MKLLRACKALIFNGAAGLALGLLVTLVLTNPVLAVVHFYLLLRALAEPNYTLAIVRAASCVVHSVCSYFVIKQFGRLMREHWKGIPGNNHSARGDAYSGPSWARVGPRPAPHRAIRPFRTFHSRALADQGASPCLEEPMTFVGARLFGYRAWVAWISEEDNECSLRPVAHYGIIPQSLAWKTAEAIAWCSNSEVGIPHESDTCGLYASWNLDLDLSLRLVASAAYGLVEASGKVIPADYGFRAERLTIRALYIPDSVTEWGRRMEVGLVRYGVPIFTNLAHYENFCAEYIKEGI